MPLSIIHLPHDVLLLIFINLKPQHLLALVQTCRVFHDFHSSDYVWHHIKHALPLDVPDNRELLGLSGAEAKLYTIRSLKLDNLWRNPNSTIKRICKIKTSEIVTNLQSLGREWLLGLSRTPASTRIWLRRLDTNRTTLLSKDSELPSSIVLSIELHSAFSFTSSLRDNGRSAVISVTGGPSNRKGLLSVYQVDLKGRADGDDRPYVVKSWKIDSSGVFYYTDICGDIVASSVVHVSEASYSHEILLLNIKTNQQLFLDSEVLSHLDCGRLRFKIFSRHIIIVGIEREHLRLLVRELPDRIFSDSVESNDTLGETNRTDEWSSVIADFESTTIRNGELYITDEPIYSSSPKTFTVMVAQSAFSTLEKGSIGIYHFPIDLSLREARFKDWKPTHTFKTPPNVTLEPMCLGKLGYRAVWLEHQWNSDELRLMRATFPADSNPVTVSLLHPASFSLPFEPVKVKSMHLEESSGRVWVGIVTGEIYLLEF